MVSSLKFYYIFLLKSFFRIYKLLMRKHTPINSWIDSYEIRLVKKMITIHFDRFTYFTASFSKPLLSSSRIIQDQMLTTIFFYKIVKGIIHESLIEARKLWTNKLGSGNIKSLLIARHKSEFNKVESSLPLELFWHMIVSITLDNVHLSHCVYKIAFVLLWMLWY